MEKVTEREYSFTRDKNDALAVQDYLNPLPRSVARSDVQAYLLLDGEWQFDLDPADQGLQEYWFVSHTYGETAMWPGTIEEHLAAAQDAPNRPPSASDTVIAWSEREFTIPTAWRDDPTSEVQLTFGACGYETRVWLNGHPLRTIEGEEVHFGEYTSFSYELPTALLNPDHNRLTMRIADSPDADIPRGKQESRVYKRGGIWYQTISGAVRSIWLEPVERNRLRSRLGIISTIEDRLVEFNVTTRVHDPGAYTLRLVVTARGGTQPLAMADHTLSLMVGEKRQRITMELPNASLWAPGSPQLYMLVAQLTAPDGHVSQIETHFGLRKIEARGRHIYLNDAPLYLDGILYQPGTASFAQMRAHLLAMRDLGCNLVRVHIAGIDPRIYDLADEIGMLLWVEVPSPHRSNEQSRINHEAEMMRMLVVTGAHPSVVIWSLYNEDWGVQDIETSVEARRYITKMFAYMRVHHPEILIVDNDGWKHVSTEGRLESHLLTAHFYTPDDHRWDEMLDKFVAGVTENGITPPLIVGDPFFYAGQIPLVVSEWGGFGFSGYGGPEETDAKTARIAAFKRELRSRPIAGDVYTQATSIEEEGNGVIDPQTGALLVGRNVLNSSSQP